MLHALSLSLPERGTTPPPAIPRPVTEAAPHEFRRLVSSQLQVKERIAVRRPPANPHHYPVSGCSTESMPK